jgi:cell filamentation protein
VSKYQFTESSIYLPGTDIPRNSLGIEAPDLLHEVEGTLLQQAYTRFITELNPTVRFDADYFIALHRDTYETLYEWAGLYRTSDMSKGGSLFCRAAYLKQATRRYR